MVTLLEIIENYEEQNSNEPQKPQLNIAAVSGSYNLKS